MIIREFGIKDVRYVNSCIALVGETAIRFYLILLKKALYFISNSRNV